MEIRSKLSRLAAESAGKDNTEWGSSGEKLEIDGDANPAEEHR